MRRRRACGRIGLRLDMLAPDRLTNVAADSTPRGVLLAQLLDVLADELRR